MAVARTDALTATRIRSSARSYATYAAMGIVLLAVAFVRLRVASVPLERDEGEYGYAAQLILQGIPPYQLAYNMKFPGTYYAYGLLLALFGQTAWGIHVGLLLVNAATIVVLFFLGRRVLGEFGGVIAAAAFAVLSLNRWILGPFAHATHFVLLPALGGMLLLLRAAETERRRDILLAGILLGTSVLMKQHAAAFVVAGAYLVARDRALPKTAMFLAGAAMPLALVCALLAAHGLLGRFLFWTVTYAKEYVTEIPASEMWHRFYRGMDEATESTFPIWWLSAAGVAAMFIVPADRRRFLVAFAAASLLAIVPGFYFRPHYFILILPGVALFAGVAVVWLQHALERRLAPAAARRAAASVFVLAVAAYVVMERDYLWSMSPRALNRSVYATNPFVEAESIGHYIRAHTGPDDRIAVLGSEPEIYFYAGRKSATGYVYAYAPMERQRYAAQMQTEMIAQIEAAQPVFIVFVRSTFTSLAQNPYEPILQWADRYIHRCYDRVGVSEVLETPEDVAMRWDDEAAGYYPPSDNTVSIYRRKAGDRCQVIASGG